MDKNKEWDEMIANLMDEEKYDEITILIQKHVDNFWEIEYPKKTIEEKIAYWASHIYDNMRSYSSESDWYGISYFSKESYEGLKELEPSMDDIFVYILEKIGLDVEKVYKAITE